MQPILTSIQNPTAVATGRQRDALSTGQRRLVRQWSG